MAQSALRNVRPLSDYSISNVLDQYARQNTSNALGGVQERFPQSTAVEQEVYKLTGMQPGLDRAALLPVAGSRDQGNLQFAAPQFMYDAAKAFVSPGVAASGREVSLDDIVNTAMALTGSGYAMSTPIEGAVAGMAIKRKGGNWLSGDVEGGLKSLRKSLVNNTDPAQQLARLEQKYGPAGAEEVLASGMYPNIREDAAMNNWIDTKLTKYIRNDMGTPEDPVRALAEQGILHTTPYQIADSGSQIMQKRLGVGMPVQPMGKSPEAQFWETVTDRAIDPFSAGAYKHGALDESILKNNPWLDKVPDDAMVYKSKGLARGLGFDHLIDELAAAANPYSGIPRNLQIDYKDLQKISMPQAVERVAKINAWRAENLAAANLAAANNAATVPFRAYQTIPGRDAPNNRGLQWVELALKDDAPESIDALNTALGYEGNTMGHSVGGYRTVDRGGSRSYGLGGWDALTNKEARIYSLRDAKGEPHVTIEIGSKKELPLQIPDDIAEQLAAEGKRIGNKKADALGYGQWSEERFLEERFATTRLRDDWKYANPTTSDRIVQIKGKGNQAPTDEYLPFVQDFVRNQNWSDVGDFKNTGLRDLNKTPALKRWAVNKGVEAPRYLTEQEYGRLEMEFLAEQLGMK